MRVILQHETKRDLEIIDIMKYLHFVNHLTLELVCREEFTRAFCEAYVRLFLIK